ncbi:MAG TPA: iron donor protein CyaY [Acidisarcina sp.]|nr:iron donor protein CyaY [Acidisarcina sp.]
MIEELEFRRHADKAIESLTKSLFAAEEQVGFEVDEQNGVLNIVFEDPAGKFVITPNAPVQQIWISALSTSFKLDWNGASGTFILPKTGEALKPLIARLISEHMGIEPVSLP